MLHHCTLVLLGHLTVRCLSFIGGPASASQQALPVFLNRDKAATKEKEAQKIRESKARKPPTFMKLLGWSLSDPGDLNTSRGLEFSQNMKTRVCLSLLRARFPGQMHRDPLSGVAGTDAGAGDPR